MFNFCSNVFNLQCLIKFQVFFDKLISSVFINLPNLHEIKIKRNKLQVLSSGPDVQMEPPIGVPQGDALSERVIEKVWQDSAVTPSQR